ncbi:dedicator of cytokinesis protein 6-like isoform X2 [Artemia franciscana]|uniref:dedicator of cytokinesis protein 6-like isoform X2 n=1 Tax=Artemia franciscana TaxID=6661 RepID=UPI0032DA34F0
MSNQRAFAQKLPRQNPTEIRRLLSPQTSQETGRNISGSISCNSSLRSSLASTLVTSNRSSLASISSAETTLTFEPIDYEDFVQQHEMNFNQDCCRKLLQFPEDDIEVLIVKKPRRTVSPLVPEEPRELLSQRIHEAVEQYNSDWVVLQRQYQQYSSSCWTRDRTAARVAIAKETPKQEFEIDVDDEIDNTQNGREIAKEPVKSISRQSLHLVDTPRGSWASFDLRNSVNDPVLPNLLERQPPEALDQMNQSKRDEHRLDAIFSLFPMQSEEEMVERRVGAELPSDPPAHRILVRVGELKLLTDGEIEPIFASMALYDVKEKKKVSENFYFDMNSTQIHQMLTSHVPYQDISTMSRSCIFNVSNSSTNDLFIVIKLEKVLQGDINECIEHYLKDDKNHREKAKGAAVTCCERLGKYRMPFAWTGIYLQTVLGATNVDRDDTFGELEARTSGSLDRKISSQSLEQLRKASNSLSRRGSLERRSGSSSEKRLSWSSEDFAVGLDNFRPVTLKVASFFKQEPEKMRDEDLFKYLPELKKSNGACKRLKCIPGQLKLDVSPCPTEPKYCLTSELAKIEPYPDEHVRPTKDLAEFPPREILVPHQLYRNLLFVYPKNINFTNKPGSARNIAVKVQLLPSDNENDALPVIFGKSSCPEFSTEYITSVAYHNRCPDFYDEIKIKLPATLGSGHHLFFTFYHVSCQKKQETTCVETPVGYTWLPLLKDGILQTGDFNLPVLLEHPPPSYNFVPTDFFPPVTSSKWLDNRKGLFTICVDTVSSIHTEDKAIETFFQTCCQCEINSSPHRIEDMTIEARLKKSIEGLVMAKPGRLVRFLPLIMNKLIKLAVDPPSAQGQTVSIGNACFESLGKLVQVVSDLLASQCDQHGRNNLLTTFIKCQSMIPVGTSLPFAPPDLQRVPLSEWSADDDIDGVVLRNARLGPRTSGADIFAPKSQMKHIKCLHEEIAFLFGMCSGDTRDIAFKNAWFFFEIIIKSMVFHLNELDLLHSPRKHRFPDRFLDDLSRLVSLSTTEIVSKVQKEGKDSKVLASLNAHLAFFMYDLFSVMDRGFVFSLVRSYSNQMSDEKVLANNDISSLLSLKIDFLRIVCSHEHYIPLNLPCGVPYYSSSKSPSPTPSAGSSSSRSSMSTLVADKCVFANLSPEFCQKHYLAGCALKTLATVLEIPLPSLHNKAINAIRNLLTCHDWDPRLKDDVAKSRVATLYLPLIGIVVEALPQIHSFGSDSKGRAALRSLGEDRVTSDDCDVTSPIGEGLAMAIAKGSVLGGLPVGSTMSPSPDPSKVRRAPLSPEASRNLLVCLLWVLKNIDHSVLRLWWIEIPSSKLLGLLEVLYSAISCFEYKGKRFFKRSLQPSSSRASDIKSKLEDMLIGGQGSARSELIQRRRERNPSPSPYGSERSTGLRWRKDYGSWKHQNSDPGEKVKVDVDLDSHIEGNLSTQAGLVVLDTIETIIKVTSQTENQNLLSSVLRVLLHMLETNQSTSLLQNIFATQRSLVYKNPSLLFDEETELCADLCLRLLRHCSSCVSVVRSQASASLYVLMRQNFEIGNNFARVKMQVTMSLSSLVGTNQNFNEEYLRRSLKTILIYADEDTELQETSFPEQVRDLVFNLHMILSDTVKMKEFQEDPEMLLDLMYRIAKGYQTSPDLRLTWLASMAQKHTERQNHAEAAMCMIHSAALVSEYMRMLEEMLHLPIGAVSFSKISLNALEESAVSDDVVCPDEDGLCSGKYFTDYGLVGLLEQAAAYFNMAGMYETVNEVYEVLIPIAKHHRDFKKLANVYHKLMEAFTRIEQQQGRRVFGSYFRVGFYGIKFGDLDGEEYIYKEPTLTKLPEISHRLESFYSERFGNENVVIIKDSNVVETAKLDSSKAYLQITYVEPYFEIHELRHRVTVFEKNCGLKRFMYATPFTPDGRPHGELHEQYKRKTILTTSHHFPYIKTRIQVVDRKQVVLTPIEVAIEDIQKRTAELSLVVHQEPPDHKILQMVLQGCIGTTVNQGPMEVAHVFLGDCFDGNRPPTKHQTKLRLCFKEFTRNCAEALRKNKNLIGQDQRDYQRELERNYQRFLEQITTVINPKLKSPSDSLSLSTSSSFRSDASSVRSKGRRTDS